MHRFWVFFATLFIICFFGGNASAQENWGPPETIYSVAGCTVVIANPAFCGSEYLYFELAELYAGGDSRLYMLPFGGWDTTQVPGAEINIEGVNNYSPFVTYSKDKLYFSSDRPGGFGGFDIWYSSWEDSAWGAPVNAGSAINTAVNEFGASLPLDESELFFFRNDLSDEYEGFIGTIYKSELIDSQWSEAEPLPDPINLNNHQVEPAISADGGSLYFISIREPNPSHCFAYVSYRTGDSWSQPQALNDNINTLVWDPLFEVYTGDVFSLAIDSSGLTAAYTYYYTFEGFIDGTLRISRLTVDVSEEAVSAEATFLKVSPNPFNATASLQFALSHSTNVEIRLYDICGRLARQYEPGILPPGRHEFMLQAGDLPSGLYFARLITDYSSQTCKLSLLK